MCTELTAEVSVSVDAVELEFAELSVSFDAAELEFPESEDSFDPHAPMFGDAPEMTVTVEMMQDISIMLEYIQRLAPLPAIGAMKAKIDALIAEAEEA